MDSRDFEGEGTVLAAGGWQVMLESAGVIDRIWHSCSPFLSRMGESVVFEMRSARPTD